MSGMPGHYLCKRCRVKIEFTSGKTCHRERERSAGGKGDGKKKEQNMCRQDNEN